ncbi:MAG: efflux RND transporter periplasmic adaptor subunit [Prevotellaceae bacterium]|nr:efflux RND transporter periplasmic adaptor subunit [Prevotellaceae bacterium]
MRKTTLLFATALVMMSCGGKNEPSMAEMEEKADSVAADTVKTEVDAVTSATNVANSPTFNGLISVAPNRIATVSLTIGGRIHSLNVMSGKAVARGQVIATLDNPEFIELQQTYLESKAQLEYLEKEYLRQKTLGQGEATSQKRVEESRADYLSMKSRTEAAATRLKALGISPSSVCTNGIRPYLPVVAPIGGFVGNLSVNLGKYVEAGMPICDVVNKSNPMLELTVYEKDIALMKVGDKLQFRVNGLGKSTFAATIVSIDQAVDKKDYSIKVYAKVSETNPQFRPGMYVRAKIAGRKNI